METAATGLLELMGRTPALAARHGLSAILVDRLRAPNPELLRDAQAQISAGLKTKRLTLAVVDAFGAVGITPILLKGYALACRLYGERPLARPASDVDVLVRPGELEHACLALETLGLRRQADPSLHDPLEEHHHLAYVGRRGGLVEVHFRLFHGLGGAVFDDEALQARAVGSKLDGRPVRLLAPEDEFVYLATHAANHAFLRLSWLVDLQRYLERCPPLDWSLMATRAHKAGFHRAVCTTLRVLEVVLEVELPPAARRHFTVQRLHASATAWLFSARHITSAKFAEHWLGAFLLRLWLVDSPAAKARYLVAGAHRFLNRTQSGS